MAERIDEYTLAARYARERLTDELVRGDEDRQQQRRQHALWCAAMTFAERGERVSGGDVLARADVFLAWIEKAEPRAGVAGGSEATSKEGS